MAWLNTAPRVETKSKSKVEQKKSVTRLQKMTDDGTIPVYPEVECGMHVISYFFEAGPSSALGMGAGPVTHSELESWQNNIGIRLLPWEIRFIRNLSKDYVSMQSEAEKIDCPAPFGGIVDDNKTDLSNRLQSAMRARMGK